ncbi:MAG: class I SAM-dependent methyltransferase [Parachlamydiales bacterium]|nr:class I SAM-dependent methyltransferase [Parachlamydiales bacterium]
MKGYNHISNWYDGIVKDKGHYYHVNIIIPKVLKLLENKKSILDLACGQGVLQRYIGKNVEYLGIDISKNMIQKAGSYNRNKNHHFLSKDLCELIKLEKKDYQSACIILSLQDISNPLNILKNAYNHLEKNGQLIIVMNHPCFRIPRQSFWQIDERKKIQYRRIDRYMSSMKIPFLVNPSKNEYSKTIFSNHFSLSTFSNYLFETNFYIEKIEEWTSDKKSTGSKAKMENISRDEFPLFMCITAIKR